MKINNRIIIILCVAICALLIALTIISHFFILNTFADIERKQASSDMQRVLTRLNDEVEDVAATCRVWAQRDDTYTFVNDLNPEYVRANLVEPTFFRNMKINYVLFYNSSGNLVYSRTYNPEDGSTEEIQRELNAIIRDSIIHEGVTEGISGRRGYSLLNGDPVIIAGYRITTSDQRGSPDGTLIMVRQLDANSINDIAQQTDLDITIRQIPKTTDTGPFNEAELNKMRSGAILVVPVNDSIMEGTAIITGIENTPSKILVTVQTSRYLYQQVQVSMAYIAGVIIILAVILILVIRWPLKKYIVNPILSLDTSMKAIGKSRDISQPVTLQGDDEIVSLACSLNRMLEEIHTAQKQVLESESKFRALAENTPDIVFSVDLNSIFTYISPQVEKYGFLFDEMVGKTVIEFVFPEDRPALQEKIRKIFEDGQRSSTSFRILDKWQNIHWIEENSTAIVDPSGKTIGLQGILRDITIRRQSLDAVTLANKKLNLMYDITRHDILNKVTILFGLIDMTNATSSLSEREQFLNEIRDTGHVIYRQIALTRDYQEVGVKSPRWNPMKDVITRAISNFSGTMVHVTSTVENLEIYADPLIEKAVYNLVDNAIRYGKKITMIAFSTRVSEKGLEFICEDDGIGIPAGAKEKIFERGFGNNTGLGLFLAREILLITGITIRENGEPETGAQFVIFLPKGTFRFVEK